MVLATVAALAGLASAGTGIYSTLTAGNRGNPAAPVANQNNEQAAADAAYMRLLNTIGLQRSVAGTEDDQGSSTWYDPATNTWKSKLGTKPAAVQAAADNASVSRNTTDLRGAQALNETLARRAAQAFPGADEARREVENFRPQQANDLTSLIMRNIVDSTNETQRPVMQDLLRNSARTGTAADSQMAALGKQMADNTRKSALEATISGRQNVGQINASMLAPLASRYSTLQGATTPSMQFSPLDDADKNKNLLSLIADRSKTAAVTPFAGMQGLTGARYGQNQASAGAGAAATGDNTAVKIASLGTQVGNLFKDDNTRKAYEYVFGKTTPANTTTGATMPTTTNFDLSSSKNIYGY